MKKERWIYVVRGFQVVCVASSVPFLISRALILFG